MSKMTLNDYQTRASATAVYPDNQALACCALGLTGEAGEVAEKIKKHLRSGGTLALDNEAVAKELGDVLWYIAAMATTLGLSLDEIAQGNLDKIRSRVERGVLQGSGDNR